MLKVVHDCGWNYEIEFKCPNCNLPFCEEDQVQALGGILVNQIKTDFRMKELEDKIAYVKNKLETCKKCSWD